MQETLRVDLRGMIGRLISVSDLSRGMASKIIQQVGKNREQYIVVKNNKPEAVILSVDEYTELLEVRENFELLQMANARMKNFNQLETLSHDDILKHYDISEEKLDKLIDAVEIE